MDSLVTLQQYLTTAVTFLIVITLLVFVHEVGHFWFAKLFGMKVDSFAVMLGGIRKTPLEEGLAKPMFPAKWVGTGLALTVGTAIASGLQGWATVYLVSLALLALVFPIWIGLRLTTLYRLSPLHAAKTLGASYAVAIGILLFSSGPKGLESASGLLSLLMFAGMIGLLILYYQPLGHRPEDAPMGHGSIHDGSTSIPVRFRPIWHTTSKAGTEFSLLALPLGGFAAIHGMHPKADGSETKIEGGFYSKSPFARLMVLFAGPLFSILLGSLLFFIQYVSFGDEVVSNKPVLGSVSEGTPLAKAGLKPGDEILSIDGKPVATFFDVVNTVRNSEGRALQFSYKREGEVLAGTVTPKLEEKPSPVLGPTLDLTEEMKRQFKMGGSPTFETVRMGVGVAAIRALEQPVKFGQMFGGLFRKPETAKDSLGGPATMMQATHRATQFGISGVLQLAALLSISLGFMNLLPVPPLDGGQMVMAIAEMFRGGKRLSIQVQHAVSTVGMFLVMALMLLVISQDTGRLLGGR